MEPPPEPDLPPVPPPFHPPERFPQDDVPAPSQCLPCPPTYIYSISPGVTAIVEDTLPPCPPDVVKPNPFVE